MRFKWVLRRDRSLKWFRVVRVMWECGEVGFGGYSAKLTFAVTDRVVPGFYYGHFEWALHLLLMRFHCVRNYGGRYT